jgi:hypothetical protein
MVKPPLDGNCHVLELLKHLPGHANLRRNLSIIARPGRRYVMLSPLTLSGGKRD